MAIAELVAKVRFEADDFIRGHERIIGLAKRLESQFAILRQSVELYSTQTRAATTELNNFSDHLKKNGKAAVSTAKQNSNLNQTFSELKSQIQAVRRALNGLSKVRFNADDFIKGQDRVIGQAKQLESQFTILGQSVELYSTKTRAAATELNNFSDHLKKNGKAAASAAKQNSNLNQTCDQLKNQVQVVGGSLSRLSKTSAFNGSVTAVNSLNAGLGETHGRVIGLQSSAQSLKNTFGGMAKLFTAALTVNELKKMSDAYTTLNNRLKLVTASEQELKTVRAELANIAASTGQNLDATAAIYQRLAQSSEQTGLQGQKLLTVTDAISKSMVIGGGSAASQEAALVQLGQALASGTLRGEELNSVLEQAPALAMSLAKGMGVSVGALRTLAASGRITSKVVADSLLKQAPAIQTEFLKTSRTIDQSFQNLKTQLTMFVGGATSSSGAAKALASSLQFVANNINLIASSILVLLGLKLGMYLIAATAEALAFTAALVAQAAAAANASRANGVYATSLGAIKGAGVVANLSKIKAAFASLKASMLALSATRVGVFFKTIASAGAGAMPVLISIASAASSILAVSTAIYSVYTAAESLMAFFQGKDASNPISDFFDKLLLKIGFLKTETDTLGGRLYDLTHTEFGEIRLKGLWTWKTEQEERAARKSEAEKKQEEARKNDPRFAVLSKEAIDLKAGLEKAAAGAQKLVDEFGKTSEQLSAQNAKRQLDNFKLKTQNEKELKAANDAYAAVIDNLNRLEIKKLSDSIADAHANISETVQNFGKTSEELAIAKQQQALETMARRGATEAELKAAEAKVEDTKKLYEHSKALEIEKQRREETASYIKDLQTRAAELKAEFEGGQNGLISYKLSLNNATNEQIRLAQATNSVIAAYEKQKNVMSTLESLQDQVAKLGLSDKEKQLYDLRKNGANEEQVRAARTYLDQIDKFNAAQKMTRTAAEKLDVAATALQQTATDQKNQDSPRTKRDAYWEEWKSKYGSSKLGLFKGEGAIQQLKVANLSLPAAKMPDFQQPKNEKEKDINRLNVDTLNLNGKLLGKEIFDKGLQPPANTSAGGATEVLKIDFTYKTKNLVGEIFANPEFKRMFMGFFAGIVADLRGAES